MSGFGKSVAGRVVFVGKSTDNCKI